MLQFRLYTNYIIVLHIIYCSCEYVYILNCNLQKVSPSGSHSDAWVDQPGAVVRDIHRSQMFVARSGRSHPSRQGWLGALGSVWNLGSDSVAVRVCCFHSDHVVTLGRIIYQVLSHYIYIYIYVAIAVCWQGKLCKMHLTLKMETWFLFSTAFEQYRCSFKGSIWSMCITFDSTGLGQWVWYGLTIGQNRAKAKQLTTVLAYTLWMSSTSSL